MYFNERLESIFTEDWARDYNPELGRFLTEDPIGFQSGDPSQYRYVNNQPISLTDPSGLLSYSENVDFRKCLLKKSFTRYVKTIAGVILGSAFLRSISKTGFNTGLAQLLKSKFAVPGLSQGFGSIANFAIGAAIKAVAFGISFATGLEAGVNIAAYFDTAVDKGESIFGISPDTLSTLGFGSGLSTLRGSNCNKDCR